MWKKLIRLEIIWHKNSTSNINFSHHLFIFIADLSNVAFITQQILLKLLTKKKKYEGKFIIR